VIRQKFLAFILTYSVGLLFLPAFIGSLHAAVDDDDSDSGMRVEEKETIRKTFSLTAAHKILEVDNIFGSIEVTGGQGDQVQMVVNKTISAESKDRMDAAKKEVTLDITDQPDFLKLYVNGPFRCKCENGNDGCRQLARRSRLQGEDGFPASGSSERGSEIENR